MGETNYGKLSFEPGPLYGLPQGDVGRDVDHLQLFSDEHHGVVFRARQFGQDLGVPGILVACQVHGLLVERRGRYRPDAPLARQPRRPLDVAEGRVTGPCVKFAEREILGQFGLGDHIYGARLEPRVFGFSADVRAQRQVQQARSPLQYPRVAYDDGHVVFSKAFFVEGSGYDLRPDPGRVPHRHGYEGLCHAFLSSPISPSSERSAATSARSPRTDSLEATLSSGERTTAHVLPASASLAAPTAFCTASACSPPTGTSTSPCSTTSRRTCSRATPLRLPTITSTGRTGALCTLAS